jgi:hypothetical protein
MTEIGRSAASARWRRSGHCLTIYGAFDEIATAPRSVSACSRARGLQRSVLRRHRLTVTHLAQRVRWRDVPAMHADRPGRRRYVVE